MKAPLVAFLAAVGLGFRRYFTFRGRAARTDFWWWVLFGVLVSFSSIGLDQLVGVQVRDSGLVSSIAYFALLLPTITYSVRRWHDLGHTGWWTLMSLIPCAGGIAELLWLTKPGDELPNRFGPPTTTAASRGLSRAKPSA